MGLDPVLFVALGLGYVAGRVWPSRGPWPGRAVFAVVFVLLLLLGTSLGRAPNAALLAAAPVGVVFALLLLGTTALVSLALRPERQRGGTPQPVKKGSPAVGGLFALALVVGFGVSRSVGVDLSGFLEPVLWLLVALVAYDLHWSGAALRRWWAPLTAAVVGAAASARVVAALFGLPLPVALATASGFGFYSLDGPLVAARLGAALGLLAFLANFLRENLVMVTSPWAGRRLKGEGLAALGGATSMDTTLFFVTRYGDPEASGLALATGLVLTLAASLALPLLLALP